MPQLLGKEIGPTGYGLMGLSWRPDPIPIEEAIAAMKAALEAGCNLWNGAEFYGSPEYNSMTILNAYFTKYPEDADKVIITMKGGVNLENLHPDGSPENIRKSLDNIIKQLGGKKKLDLFSCSRRDSSVPLETTFGVIQKEYIDTGKLGGIALSECSAKTVREASKITKVHIAEVELSMFSPDILKNDVAKACAENNILIEAYSPMGRGLLTGRFKEAADFKQNGIVAFFPRFQDATLQHNLTLVKQVESLAEKKGYTNAQLALAWVRKHSDQPGLPCIVPLPGATTPTRVAENANAVELTDEEFASINKIVEDFEVAGDRYPTSVLTNT